MIYLFTLVKYILFSLRALLKLFLLPRMSFSHIFLIHLTRLNSDLNFSIKAFLTTGSGLCSLSYELPQLFKPLLQWFSKCDPWISSISWGLFRKPNFGSLSRLTESEALGMGPSNLFSNKPSAIPTHPAAWKPLL